MILFFNDIKDWNDLPAMIKQIMNKTSLKKVSKTETSYRRFEALYFSIFRFFYIIDEPF